MEALFAKHPEVLALIILAIAALGATVLAHLMDRTVRLFNERLAAQDLLAWQLSEAWVNGLRRVTFALALGVGLLAAGQVLGVGSVALALWFQTALGYLPRLVAGAVIVGAGYALAILARGVIERLWGQDGQVQLAGPLVQWSLIVIAGLTGLKQVGVEVSLAADLALLVFAISFASLALAFALGARQLVANLLARRDLDRYPVGQRIRVGGHEGRIVELAATMVVLETQEGQVSLPASLFAQEPVLSLEDD